MLLSVHRIRFFSGVIAALLAPQLTFAQGYIINTLAGGAPYITSIGDGQPATNAYLNDPSAVAVDSAGTIFIADTGNNLIRKVAPSGVISTFAGLNGTPGFSGDGGLATKAALHGPTAVAVDTQGNVFIADTTNNRIRKVAAGTGIITTVAGSANTFANGGVGDGGPATSANLSLPRFVLPDKSGNLYISDTGNRRVRKVDASGIITTYAGNGQNGSAGAIGDGGAPALANVGPAGLALDGAGNLYIADFLNSAIRKISGGLINSIAGNGNPGYFGDSGVATHSMVSQPLGIAVDGAGNVFISDTGNDVIREITTNGNINTIAGTGDPGSYGDAGPAGAATIANPSGIALGSNGWLYMACGSTSGYKDSRIRALIPATGSVPTIKSAGIVPVYSSSGTIAPGSWISIYGTNLASTTVSWNSDFPTALGQTSVLIDNKPAYLWYVSPTQINAQVPDDANVGNAVFVFVITPAGNTNQVVNLASVAPSLSLLNSKYAAAVVFTPNSPGNSGGGYDIIGPSGAFPYTTRPVSAGETLVFYGVGFGPTTPVIPAGQLYSGAAPLATLPTVTIGNVAAQVNFGGIVAAGLYQFNVVVPSAGSGDQAVLFSVGGVTTQSGVYVTLK